MTQDDDQHVLAAAQAGDGAAWETLVQRHLDAVTAWVAKRCPRWSLVDDVVQESFVRVWSGKAQPDGRGPLRAWLIGVARNVLREELRRSDSRVRRLDTLLLDAMPGDDDAEQEARAAELQAQRMDALRTCLDGVGEPERKLLDARYQQGRQLAELARAYKRKTATIAKQIQRLATGLRTCMEGRLS